MFSVFHGTLAGDMKEKTLHFQRSGSQTVAQHVKRKRKVKKQPTTDLLADDDDRVMKRRLNVRAADASRFTCGTD